LGDVPAERKLQSRSHPAGARTLTVLTKRSFTLAGHRTSVALEPEFWAVLLAIAQSRGQTLSALVAAADAARGPDRPLASALRVLALQQAGAKPD
jgi:predicted DNA-binding ribbon-helix-helix protein